MFGREWAEQPNFQDANFLSTSKQLFDDFFAGTNCRTHQDNDTFRLWMTVILKGLILAARRRGEVVHRLFDVFVNRVVPGICRFTRLEVGIRVRRCPANNGMFRVQRAGTMRINFSLRHQAEDRVIGQRHNFIDFMRCAETIKEMNKRNPTFQSGHL